jgi:inorganic triphosphatase YgiF
MPLGKSRSASHSAGSGFGARAVHGHIMGHEIELKFLIAEEAVEAVLAQLPGQAAVRWLDAVYYDTVDYALRRAGLALRVRDGEGGRRQTLKSASAGGVFTRGEWEAPVEGPEPDLRLLIDTPAARVLNGDPLVPVFTARVERLVWLVEHGGATIEAALDRGVLTAGDRGAGVCELELELKAGPPAALFDLARDLAAHAPLRLSLVSKAERGYALALDDGDQRRPGVDRDGLVLDPDMTAGQALQALGRSALARLCADGEGLRERQDSEGLHRLRVAARRFRALLSVFRSLADDEAALRVRAELKWLAGALGPARDLDVFIAEVWRPAATTSPPVGSDDGQALAAFGQALIDAQVEAYARAMAALDSARYRALTLETAAWLEAGSWLTAHDVAKVRDGSATALARKALDKRRRTILKRGKHLAALDPAARHAVRIRGKVLRYAAEDLAPLFPDHPRRAARFIEAVKALQDALGALNDLIARDALARAVARASDDARAAVVAGQLATPAGAEGRRMPAAVEAYDAFARAKPFW